MDGGNYTLISKLHTGPGGRVSTYTFTGAYGNMVVIQLALVSFLLSTVNMGAQRAVGVTGSTDDGTAPEKSVTIAYQLHDPTGEMIGSGSHAWERMTDSQAVALRALLRRHIEPFREHARREKIEG